MARRPRVSPWHAVARGRLRFIPGQRAGPALRGVSRRDSLHRMTQARDETSGSPLAERAERLPTGPGVYLFKNARGSVLYVGKAQNLRSRVKQYVLGGDGRITIPKLL